MLGRDRVHIHCMHREEREMHLISFQLNYKYGHIPERSLSAPQFVQFSSDVCLSYS